MSRGRLDRHIKKCRYGSTGRHFFIQFIYDNAAEALAMHSKMNAGNLRGASVVRYLPTGITLCFALLVNFVFVSGHDMQRVVELAVLLALGLFSLSRRFESPLRSWLAPGHVLVAIFFLLGLVSAASAYSLRLSLIEISIFFLLYVVADMIGQEIRHAGHHGLLLLMQLIGGLCALHAVTFLVAYSTGLSLGNAIDMGDFAAGFSNIRFFNHVQTATLPLLILLCSRYSGTEKLRWLWFAVTAYWWMALFATTGRGTLMGMAAGCLILVLVLRRAAVVYMKMVVLTASLGLLAYFVLLVMVPTLLGIEEMQAFSYAIERTANDPASGRLILWRRAVELIVSHPWLGVGPMHFAHYAGDLHIGAHPHDWLLQIGSEWGLMALACLIVAIALALCTLVRTGKQVTAEDFANQGVFAALLMTASAILTDGLVSGVFVMPQSQLAIAMYIGCAMGWCRIMLPAVPLIVHRGALRAGSLVLAIAAICGIGSAWPEWFDHFRGEPSASSQAMRNVGPYWPRLWKDGYF